MVERLAARPRRLNEDPEIVAGLALADEFGKPLRPQARFGGVFVAALGRNNLASGIAAHRSGPRVYLFGNSSAIGTIDGELPFGTITRAFGS